MSESVFDLNISMFNIKAPKKISFPFDRVCDETKELQFVLAGRMHGDKLEVIANNDLFHLKVDSRERELSLWGGEITKEQKFHLHTNLGKEEEFIIRNTIQKFTSPYRAWLLFL